jgi:hypothetical protein
MEKALKKREEEKAREAARLAMMRRKETYWKPKPGSNSFRLLPPWTDDGPNSGQFWREVYVHFGVTCFDSPDPDNAFSVSCPKETPHAAELCGLEPDSAMTCPVCEAVAALRQSQDPADVEMAKNSRAKQRLYSNIIDLDDPTWTQEAIDEWKAKNCPEDFLPTLGDVKIQVFTYGPQIMNMILDFFSDNVDLTDLTNGRDLFLEREGTGKKTKYRLRPNLEATEAPIEDDQLSSLEDLDKVMPFFSVEQQEAILAGASAQEVFALADKEKAEALPEGETEEYAGELPEHKEELEDDAEAKADEGWPPVDSDGDIDWSALTDEQIEDPDNAEFMDASEVSVHLNCYGGARQRDENDEDCKDNCGLFERCGKRIAFLDEEKKKADAAAKKKVAGKKGAGKKAAGKKATGKKGAGKGNGASKAKSAAKATGGAVDDLEAEMKAALRK